MGEMSISGTAGVIESVVQKTQVQNTNPKGQVSLRHGAVSVVCQILT